jgi:hypothetical protein
MTDTEVKPATMAEVRRRNEPQSVCSLGDFASADSLALHTAARVFSYLAETAGPIMEHYHSDLYHDAMYLQEAVAQWNQEAPLVWYWSVNQTGTTLSVPEHSDYRRDYAFVCTLYIQEGSFHKNVMFTMRRVDNDGQ